MFNLSTIKMALEYAQFQDYRIRDGVNDLLKAIEADMDEVGFEISPLTKKKEDDFESLLTDIETARAPKPPRIDIESGEKIESKSVHQKVDDDIEQSVKRVTSVDEELDEFIAETTKVHNKKQ